MSVFYFFSVYLVKGLKSVNQWILNLEEILRVFESFKKICLGEF